MNMEILFGVKEFSMSKSPMRKLAMACIAAFALLGGVGTANAQMHGGGFHGGGFHGGGFHGGGFHGGGFHGGGFHARSHGRIFIGAPIIVAPGYYPYGYPYSYGYAPFTGYGDPSAADVEPQDSGSNYWYYCQNPAGYYPAVQTCPSGWLQVVPNG
jgi:hypothetical protein